MIRCQVGRLATGLLAVALCVGAIPTPSWGQQTVRIALVQSMFRGIPDYMTRLAVKPFTALVKDHTGLTPKLVIGGDAFDVGRKLHADEVDLAVFNGIELAWARSKYPDLQPLMIAVNKHGRLRANLVVKEKQVKVKLADFKGTTLALPQHSKEHCRVFLEHHCLSCANSPSRSFFGNISTYLDCEEALDQVVLGKAGVAIVDDLALENYQENKPACACQLKVLLKSGEFPVGVIAYRAGALEETTLRRFRQGLSQAGNTSRGREMMSWWRIRTFLAAPQNYVQELTDIVKTYPPLEIPTSTNSQN